jgi:hypothetical protein
MKSKISITLNDSLTNFIDLFRGDVPRSKFIENYLRDSMGVLEAVWTFSDEMKGIGVKRRLSSDLSQPLGKQLHAHEGFVYVNENALNFYDKALQLLISANKNDIKNVKVSFDSNFRRLRDSRGLNPPLTFRLGRRKVYLFAKKIGDTTFRGDNEYLVKRLPKI